MSTNLAEQWKIEEDTKSGGFQIKRKLNNHLIDASKSSTDIRATLLRTSKKEKKKKSQNNWNGNCWPENWATCWLLLEENGSRVENITRKDTVSYKSSTSSIDANIKHIYGQDVLFHAILAEELGVRSVKILISYSKSYIYIYINIK